MSMGGAVAGEHCASTRQAETIGTPFRRPGAPHALDGAGR